MPKLEGRDVSGLNISPSSPPAQAPRRIFLELLVDSETLCEKNNAMIRWTCMTDIDGELSDCDSRAGVLWGVGEMWTCVAPTFKDI